MSQIPDPKQLVGVIVGRVPFIQELNIQLVEVTTEQCTLRLPFTQKLSGNGKAFHGGAISALVDTTGAMASLAGHTFEAAVKGSTVSMNVNYLAAALGEDVLATARVLRRGKEITYTDVDVATASGKPVAKGTVIYRVKGMMEEKAS